MPDKQPKCMHMCRRFIGGIQRHLFQRRNYCLIEFFIEHALRLPPPPDIGDSSSFMSCSVVIFCRSNAGTAADRHN